MEQLQQGVVIHFVVVFFQEGLAFPRKINSSKFYK